jgi:DNA-binding MarR family transcriptional regulator
MAKNNQPPSLPDPMDALLGYQLRRASSVMMADLASTLRETGLRPVEATILLVIESSPGCTQSDVGRLLAIKRANMVPLVAGLFRRDLIYRAPVDGRSQALFLSPAGEALAREARKAIDTHEQRFQALFDDPTMETVLATLREIRQHG